MSAEGEAVADVRAGHVQFDAGDAAKAVHRGAGFGVIPVTVAGDVDDHRAGHLLNLGDFFRQEAIQAHVGQADRVEHPGPGFDDAGGLVAGAFFAGNRLGDESAEP